MSIIIIRLEIQDNPNNKYDNDDPPEPIKK